MVLIQGNHPTSSSAAAERVFGLKDVGVGVAGHQADVGFKGFKAVDGYKGTSGPSAYVGHKGIGSSGMSLLDCKGGKCGGAFSDSDAAMSALVGGYDKHAEISRFLRSNYSLEDAQRALEVFNFLDTIEDAKAYIGMKIDNGTEGLLKEVGITTSELDEHELLAVFENSSYTEADARAAVAAFNFLDNVDDAKRYIGLKILNGYEDMLAGVGIRPGSNQATTGGSVPTGYEPQACLQQFQRSTYSESDARKAVKAFDFLNSVKEAKEYIGLKIINGTQDILSRVGITPHPFDRHECLDAFHGSSYTSKDAETLFKNAGFLGSRKEAKEYIGLKIVNGNENLLSQWGVEPKTRG